jgi:hypothetical protein
MPIEQVVDFERRRTALLEQLQDGRDFWEDLESTLSAYRATSVSGLPTDLQEAITEKLGDLPSQSELELQIATLNQQEAGANSRTSVELRALPSPAAS